ncbi:hypothetical protein Acr_17g0004350 [Actinidia rufa]|uniref:Uncharacterized protein n=1 Tax=Actinidia rufa TaxID=165716 RepID=A0A7J0G264_9ERIC|nr:hypothetical protein Acr_17g0004350 [Actinidia rufa]
MDFGEKRGKKKVFACFRPVAIDDEGSLKPDDSVISFIRTTTAVAAEERRSLAGVFLAYSKPCCSRLRWRRRFVGERLGKIHPQPRATANQRDRRKASNKENEKPKLRDSSYAEDCRIDSNRWPSLNYSSSATASTPMCSSRASSVTSNSRSSSQRKGSFRENSESKQVDRAIFDRERKGRLQFTCWIVFASCVLVGFDLVGKSLRHILHFDVFFSGPSLYRKGWLGGQRW